MGREIERKFHVLTDFLPKDAFTGPSLIIQGYLSKDPCVRIRLEDRDGDEFGFITIKGKGMLSRAEYEYEISPQEARQLLSLCQWMLSKRRYKVKDDQRWDIDQFLDPDTGKPTGMWVAEIELASENEEVPQHPWLGAEVTYDPAYANVNRAVKVR